MDFLILVSIQVNSFLPKSIRLSAAGASSFDPLHVLHFRVDVQVDVDEP